MAEWVRQRVRSKVTAARRLSREARRAKREAREAWDRYADLSHEARCVLDDARRIKREARREPRLRCVSDRYDREGGIYDDVDDFYRMCAQVFGELPELTQVGPWRWHDAHGAVLVREGEEA